MPKRDLELGNILFVAVDRTELRRLRAVATRLYSEDRMNGNDMRDLGHTITAVLDSAIDVPDPDASVPVTHEVQLVRDGSGRHRLRCSCTAQPPAHRDSDDWIAEHLAIHRPNLIIPQVITWR